MLTHEAPSKVYVTDSTVGYKVNTAIIEDKMKNEPDAVVLTNLPYLLSNDYAWNEAEGKSEIYLYSVINGDAKFRNISELTNREIRHAHNVEKMYRSGAFDCDEEE
jgi:hypothetical protein